MGFVMDPRKVFGNGQTATARGVSIVLKLSMAELEAHKDDWIDQIKFDYGLSQDKLTMRNIRPGQMYVVVYESGRMDRFSITQDKKLKFFLTPNKESIFYLPDLFQVGARVFFEECKRGSHGQVIFPKGRIKKIFLIYHLDSN